jgi:hypothetical protein
MSLRNFLIDTNVIIHLEDHKKVEPAFSTFTSLASKHKVNVFVHAAARDDLSRDTDSARRSISLSKIEKFQILEKVRGLTREQLTADFGKLARPNDEVDAVLLHALKINAADFIVTQDRGLHDRARRHSADLGRRVLFVPDAVQLLRTTFEPKDTPVRFIEEVPANSIHLNDTIFDSLREGYPDFDNWWTQKCVNNHRRCWIVEDEGIAAILVRKDETKSDTDATQKFDKILKICTFKVRPEKRGRKMGELLLKKVFWFAQLNGYGLIYITTYDTQIALIELLEYYGFENTSINNKGERIYEKLISTDRILPSSNQNRFDTHRQNYPRFIVDGNTEAFGVPIKEDYHDVLYPDLRQLPNQLDFFDPQGRGNGPKRPGNTIRKVYLCRSQSNLGSAGSLLMFYKGKSKLAPSQAVTAIGVLEDVGLAKSTNELHRMTGERSVYSKRDLEKWNASTERPVKVINYLLSAYVDPAISIELLKQVGIFKNNPPQSIFKIEYIKLKKLLSFINLGFKL